MQRYHDIFIPDAAVLRDAGKRIFTGLARPQHKEGKNLVVVGTRAMRYLEDLDRSLFGQRVNRFLGELEALIQGTAVEGSGDFRVFPYSGKLDVAFFRKEGEYSLADLESHVRTSYKDKIDHESGKPSVLTSNSSQRIELKLGGIRAEEPDLVQVNEDVVNTWQTNGFDELYALLQETRGSISLDRAQDILGQELFWNQFVRFSIPAEGHPQYARVTGEPNWVGDHLVGYSNPVVRLLEPFEYGETERLRIGRSGRKEILGISPRDMEQYLALQYGLLNPNISLMFLCGKAGCGKTLLSYAAAVEQVLWYPAEKRKKIQEDVGEKGGLFSKVRIVKPTDLMGGKRRDMGFLPGDLWDKYAVHLQPFEDAHETTELGRRFPFKVMFENPRYDTDFGRQRKDYGTLSDGGRLPGNGPAVEFLHSALARGRSLADQIVIYDEFQNFTPYEAKQLITRVTGRSKVIVLGDPYQLDNPECTPKVNGLTSAIEHFWGKPYAALVTLSRTQRHQMVTDATGWDV